MIDLTEVNKSWAEPRKTTMPETKPTQPGQTNFQPWTLPGAYQKWSTGDPDYNAADDAWADRKSVV